MWLDNASEVDILFYEPYANVIADISKNPNYKPLTIGVFGVWGAGKSTLLKLIEQKIDEDSEGKGKTLCININAWTFEGYEDAKIALMEALLREIKEHKDIPSRVKNGVSKLLKKLDFFKLATKAVSVGAPMIASVATGNPIPLLLSVSGKAEDGNNKREGKIRMGTSKGYIPPAKPEWSNAKRAVSGFLRNRDSDSRANAIQKFGEAMNSSAAVGSTSFASAAGNIMAFARDISKYGLEHGLANLGRSDLIGKSSDEILQELLYQFTNDSSSLEDSLAADSLSQALENLRVDSVEQLGSVDLDILLKEMVTSFVLISFDLNFDEKIGKGRTSSEKFEILDEMHSYIADELHASLHSKELKQIDFSNISAASIVRKTLKEAYDVCIRFYGEARG